MGRTTSSTRHCHFELNGNSSGACASDPEDAQLVQQLAVQAFHLPGNNWSQDWRQYMINNHPVIGVCCHHPLHPIKARTRTVALLGTIVMGVAMTNLFHLFYLWNPNFNQPVFQLENNNQQQQWTLTTGMLLLWTLGGSIHAAYNLFLWHIAACACCRVGGCCATKACCPSLGKQLLRVLVGITLALAILVVFLRVAITSQENLNEDQEKGIITSVVDATMAPSPSPTEEEDGGAFDFLDPENLELKVDSAQEFHFLIGYCVEMVLALFIYHPIGGTILFSGIVGCNGRIPVLGGRPYELQVEARREAKRRQAFEAQLDSMDTDCEETPPKPVPVKHHNTFNHLDDLELQRDDTDDTAESSPRPSSSSRRYYGRY